MLQLSTNLKDNIRMVYGLIVLVAITFLVGSMLISFTKSMSNSCKESWGVERFVQGDWFCDTSKDCIVLPAHDAK